MSDEARDPETMAEGSLISHLLELRNRLMKAFLAVVLLAIPCLWYANDLFTFIAQPLMQKLPPGASMIATNVVTPFSTPLKLGIYTAIFIAMPVILYQLWAFVAPGLYRHEKRFAMPLLLSSVVLFYSGIAFAYYFVYPYIFGYFVSTAPKGVLMMTDINSYLDFVVLLSFAFGLAFEVPIATVLLVLTGLVRIESLKRNRGYVLIGIFVIAAVMTPPDAISQVTMAVPMYALYEIGILMGSVLMKAKLRRAAEEEAREKQAGA